MNNMMILKNQCYVILIKNIKLDLKNKHEKGIQCTL